MTHATLLQDIASALAMIAFVAAVAVVLVGAA